jgi:hypothetical protein
MPPLSLMQAQSASANAAESAAFSAKKGQRDADAFCCMSRCLPPIASFLLRLFAGL